MRGRAWLSCVLVAATCAACGQSQNGSAGSAKSAPAARTRGDAESELLVRRECSTFIDTINQSLERIQRVSARRAENEREMRRDLVELDELYRELHERLARLELSNGELAGFSQEYLAMIRRVQTSLKTVVRALDRRDVSGAERARTEFTGVVELEDDLVDRINAFCDFPPERTA